MEEGIVFYFLALLCLFLSSLFSGYLLLRISGFYKQITGQFSRVFASSLLGLVFLVLLYSLIKSGAYTVNVFFIPVLVQLCFSGAKHPRIIFEPEPRNLKSSLILTIISLVLPFCYFAMVLFKGGVFPWHGVDYDNVMYAKLSEELRISGLENRWVMYFSDPSLVKGLEPYHYFESWTNAMCQDIFRSNSVLGFYLLVYPVFLSIAIIGLMAMFEHFGKAGWLQLVLSVAFLFIGPVYQLKMMGYEENRMSCEIPWQCYGEKFSAYYPFIILALLLLLKGQDLRGYLVLMGLCIVSATLLPAILISFFLFLIVLKPLRKALLITAAPFLFLFVLFYVFNSSDHVFSLSSGSLSGYSGLHQGSMSTGSLKMVTGNFIVSFLTNLKNFMLVYIWIIPFFLLMWRILGPVFVKRICIPLLLCLSGLFASAGLLYHPDSHQLFSNTLVILHVAAICLFVSVLDPKEKRPLVTKLIYGFILVFALNSGWCSLQAYKAAQKSIDADDQYILSLKDVIKGVASKKVGLLCTPEDYVRYFVLREKNSLYQLSYLGLDPLPINLSSPEILSVPDSLLWQRGFPMIRESDSFFRFAKSRSGNLDSLRSLFIDKTDLKYVILTPHYPYPVFLDRFKPKIVTDKASKLRFVSLN